MDWKPIIAELAELMPQKDIAAHVGLAVSTISELKTGDIITIEYTKGCALLELHRKETRKARKRAARCGA